MLPDYEFGRGDVEAALAAAPHRLRGQVRDRRPGAFLSRRPGLARHSRRGPRDDRCTRSTQDPTEVQHIVARILGIPDAFVTVETRRMGGGFGGKESQACAWAAIAALGARVTGAPCKVRLDRDDDFDADRQAPRFPRRLARRLRRRGRISVYEVDAQRALRLLGRPFARRRRPRDVSRLQLLLAAGRARSPRGG